MSGWTTKKLGEVCVFLGDGDWIESKDQSSNGIRLIQTGNVGQGCFIPKEKNRHYVTEATFKRLNCTEIFAGDILISRLPEPVGRACIIPQCNERMITAVDCSILRLHHSICDEKYLVYYASSAGWFSDVDAKCTGSTRKRISRKNLQGIEIPIPPLAEQKRIVAKIDAAFEKIDRLKANAEKNLTNAKELLQSALDEAMRPKKGWVEKQLGEVCSITSNMVDPTLPQFANMLHVGGGNIICETGDLVDLKTAKEEKLKSGKYLFDMEMVLYNKIRPYLKKVARPFFGGLCSADMYPLLPNSSITRDYLYYLLLTTQFTTYAIGESERAGMPKVNREELFAYCMEIPASLAEQKQIAKRLDLLSQKTKALQQNYAQLIADCAEMRQTILREAFEGKMRTRRDALRNLAGSWIDSRATDEIAKDIERHRTAGRRVDL